MAHAVTYNPDAPRATRWEVTDIETGELVECFNTRLAANKAALALNLPQLAKHLTNSRIEQLMIESGEAGDTDQVAICMAALDGDSNARMGCARVIEDARLSADTNGQE